MADRRDSMVDRRDSTVERRDNTADKRDSMTVCRDTTVSLGVVLPFARLSACRFGLRRPFASRARHEDEVNTFPRVDLLTRLGRVGRVERCR